MSDETANYRAWSERTCRIRAAKVDFAFERITGADAARLIQQAEADYATATRNQPRTEQS